MYIEVYLDIVFAINFILDFFILILEKKIIRKNVSLNRIFFGAFVGAVMMCIIILIPKLNYIIYLALSYFFSSALMIIVTFQPKKVIELVKLTLLLYMIAIFLGGIIFTLYYYSRVGMGLNQLMENSGVKGLDLQMLILFVSVAMILFFIFMNIFLKVTSVSKNIYHVELFYNEQEIKITALLDTGNGLYDPITNAPVIIGEIDIFKEYLKTDQYEELKNIANNIYDISQIEDIQKSLGIKVRWIPFTSLGNENGMMIGIVLDKIVVHIGKNVRESANVVLAVYNKKLSKDNSYCLLLHPKLI